MLQRFRHGGLRPPLMRLLVVALVMRALVPAGFMPASMAGWPALQICGPAAGLLAGLIDEGGGAPGTGAAHEVCAFASSPSAAPLSQPQPVSTLNPVADAAPEFHVPASTALSLPRAHRPRGPPSPA